MIHEKFVTADTHYFHTNTWLKFKRDDGSPLRPFQSNEEMHECLIKRWNSVVSQNDYIYHLGDVTMYYGKAFNELMSRLNGKKRLILGNHDKIKGTNLMDWFEKVELWKGFHDSEDKNMGFTMSHMPLREGTFRDGQFNVHGHTHEHHVKGPYINVCVETRDYTPVPFDILFKEISELKRDLDNRAKINRNLNP